MFPSFLAAALALTALTLAPVARAQGAADVQKALQADYSGRDGAFGRKDIDGTLAHYAPDFVGVSSTGKAHDLKEERADFLHTFALNKTATTKSTVDKVTLARRGAEATATVRRHGVLLFADPKTGADDVVVLDGVFQDVWAKRGSAWLLTREQTSSVKATMNGKPL